MKNTLTDLNNALCEAIDRVHDDGLTEVQRPLEIRRAEAVTKVAEVIVRNGELALKTMMHINECGYNDKLAPIPAMLEAGK